MRRAIAALAACGLAQGALAQEITITVENLLDPGNFSGTPFWLAAHNGGFDSYNHDELASGFPWLEALAEEGDTGPISTAFDNSAAGAAGGVQTTLVQPDDAPVFSPGESASTTLNVGDPTVNRWLSFASMIVPSNDLFIGNDDPFTYEIFDAGGSFAGPLEILVFGRDVNDGGTEVNDAFGGAAFSVNGGTSVDENNPIRDFFTDPDDVAYLESFLGTDTIDGNTITSVFGPDDAMFRITVTPAPASAVALGALGALGTGRRR